MRALRPRCWPMLVGLLASLPGPASPQEPFVLDGEIVEGALGARLDSVLTEMEGVSGSFLVARDGRIVLAKGYGLARAEPSLPNAVDLPYDIGSMTKLFTAAGVLLLEREGRLDADAPLSTYFLQAGADTRDVTLLQLLTHTAGFPEYSGGDYTLAGRDDVVAQVLSTPPDPEPGTIFAYSNSGYTVLGALLEMAAGQPYEEFLRERIFDPLGMPSTGYALPTYDRSRTPHSFDVGQWRGDPLDYRWYDDGPSWNLRANGGMYSTLQDLYRYWLALRDGRLFTPEELDRYWAGHAPISGRFERYGTHYGYGWFVGETTWGTRLIQHSGAGPMSSDYRLYPDDDAVIIVLENTLQPISVEVSDALHEALFMDRLEGRSPAP